MEDSCRNRFVLRPAKGSSHVRFNVAAKDTLSSLVVFCFALAAFIFAKDFSGGAELFPRGLAAIMMLLSGIIFVRSIAWPRAVPEGIRKLTSSERSTTAIAVALTLAYIALIEPLGFFTAGVLFITATSYVLGMRSHFVIWITAFCFMGCVYLIFARFFHTPLPRELVFSLFS